MFLHVCVILFTGGVLSQHALQQISVGGAWSRGGSAPRGCLVPGGVCSRRGGAWQRLPRTATAAGGTHPTGMHSCYHLCSWQTNLVINGSYKQPYVPLSTAVADPGFSPGGGANSQNCYYFSHFCQKLHENERIWTPRGGARPWRPPLDPPMHCYIWRCFSVLDTSFTTCKYHRV